MTRFLTILIINMLFLSQFMFYDSNKFNKKNKVEILNTVEVGDWKTIVQNVKDGKVYKVGDTKKVDMGKLGIHTIRVANNTTIDECKNDNYSQTACGVVLEFTDIITIHNVNSENVKYSMGTNIGGWKNSEIRKYVNNDIYNLLPLELKSSIIDTKVISGHGKKDNSNFMTKDKLYLLSSVEVWRE